MNPNTLGLFGENVAEIAHVVGAGGWWPTTGPTSICILGVVRPGDMGFDIVHSNLHQPPLLTVLVAWEPARWRWWSGSPNTFPARCRRTADG
jgi:hypothetical protein